MLRHRVLIVDDDPMARSGIAAILGSAADIEVVAEAADGHEALEKVRAHRVDVVLMDLRMSGLDGVEATRALRAGEDPPSVVVLTSWDVNDALVRSVRAGADSFLLKTAAPGEIIEAVRNVVAGDAVVSPRSTRQLLDHIVRTDDHGRRDEAAQLMQLLSAREREVSTAVAEGLSNQEIAERLHVSAATVKAALANAQGKLDVPNRVGVAVLAERAGLTQ